MPHLIRSPLFFFQRTLRAPNQPSNVPTTSQLTNSLVPHLIRPPPFFSADSSSASAETASVLATASTTMSTCPPRGSAVPALRRPTSSSPAASSRSWGDKAMRGDRATRGDRETRGDKATRGDKPNLAPNSKRTLPTPRLESSLFLYSVARGVCRCSWRTRTRCAPMVPTLPCPVPSPSVTSPPAPQT